MADILLVALAAFFVVRLAIMIAKYDPKKMDKFDGDVSGWN